MIYYDCENIPFKALFLEIAIEKGEGFDEILSQKKQCSEKVAYASADDRP